MERWIFTFLLLCCSLAGFTQYIFKGRVSDQYNKPLQGITISLDKDYALALTDSVGNYSMKSSQAEARLTFSGVGFISEVQNCTAKRFELIVLDRDVALMEETIVKAFESNKGLNTVSASVSVLSRTILDRFPAQSFVSAFNTIPGVKMDQRSPGSYRLNIRGNLLRSTFGVRNVKVYWNGIPFTDASGNTYFNELSPAIIGKIEVIKGPSGSMYGAGTGGVVLLNSSVAAVRKKQLYVNISSGSFGANSANASYEVGGKASQVLTFSHAQANGYREQSRMRRDNANYIFTVATSHSSKLDANVFYSDLYYQTPGGLTLAEMKKNPSGARPAAGVFPGSVAQKASLHLKTLYTSVSNDVKFGKYWQNITGIYGSYTDFTNPAIRNFERKFEQGMGGRTILQFKNKIFTHSIGGEFQYGLINTSVSGNRSGVQDTLQFQDRIQSKQGNVFLQTHVQASPAFAFDAGISYNKFYYGFNRISNPALSKLSSGFRAQIIPRISASIKIKTINFYLALSEGYSPPSIDEIHASNGIFNTALAAETSINYEAGLKGFLLKDKLWIDISYYVFGLKNTIVSRRDSSGAEFYINAGKTNQHGFEAALRYHLLEARTGFFKDLLCWLNLSATSARFKNYQQGLKKFDGNRLTGTPDFVAGGGFGVKIPAKIYLNSNFSYTGAIPLNDANTFFSERYNLINLKLGKVVMMNQTTSFDFYTAYEWSLNNPYSLGNDLNAAGNRYYNPSAPRTFTIGARCTFNLK